MSGNNPTRQRRWVSLVTIPLSLVRVALAPVYDIAFGWLDKRVATENQKRLTTDIKIAMRLLFTESNAQFVPNEGVPFPPGFDAAFVTVAFDSFLLRFCRAKGELGVHVAPLFARSDWHELSLVLSAIKGDDEPSRKEFRDLAEVSSELRLKLGAIAELFSVNRFPALKQQLESVYTRDRILRKEAEAKLNAWTYPNKH